jgi:8-oxo-dGTP pyrophosphatase MutT (NUDIX family)
VPSKTKHRKQVAALPVRRAGGELQVLLITSRRSGHWLIPKGWPMRRLSSAEAAAIEASQEAGVEGVVSSRPLGRYEYLKVFPDETSVPCRVDVFMLRTKKQHSKWREKKSRVRRWMSFEEAAEVAHERGLKKLLRDLGVKVTRLQWER